MAEEIKPSRFESFKESLRKRKGRGAKPSPKPSPSGAKRPGFVPETKGERLSRAGAAADKASKTASKAKPILNRAAGAALRGTGKVAANTAKATVGAGITAGRVVGGVTKSVLRNSPTIGLLLNPTDTASQEFENAEAAKFGIEDFNKPIEITPDIQEALDKQNLRGRPPVRNKIETTADTDLRNVVPGTLTEAGAQKVAEQEVRQGATLREPEVNPDRPGTNPESAIADAALESEADPAQSNVARRLAAQPQQVLEGVNQPVPKQRTLRPAQSPRGGNIFQSLAGLSFATNTQRAQVDANQRLSETNASNVQRADTLRESLRDQFNTDRQFGLDTEDANTRRFSANTAALKEQRAGVPTESDLLKAQEQVAELNDPENSQARKRGIKALQDSPESEQGIATATAFIEALSASSNEGVIDFLRVPISRLLSGAPNINAKTSLEGFEFQEDGQIFFDDGTLTEAGEPNRKFVTDIKDIGNAEFKDFAKTIQIQQARIRQQSLRTR